jgi:cell division protein FtsI/penicillin-binding protein 2
VYWDTEDARWYPEAQIMSALTGFVGYVGDTKKGQYGLEGYFQNELAGTAGSFSAQLDQGGRYIAGGEKDVTDAQNGDMLVLTIDRNIQYKACSVLQEAFDKFSAKRGSLIIENPKTGAIMAMCSVPAYDANEYSKVDDIAVYQNNAISYEYEPGSVMKAIAIAASVNEGKITPYTTYNDVGEIHLQGFPIYNYTRRAYGTVDMITVLKESLNLGSVYAVQQIGNEKWDHYMHAFGFGKETNGSIRELKSNTPINQKFFMSLSIRFSQWQFLVLLVLGFLLQKDMD